MAGELKHLREGGTVLTAGDEAPVSINQVLTASEVAAFNLDADLVLLSACNTAASDGSPYGEGFSGLTRALLQAGARTLLVSHWPIASRFAADVTTSFTGALKRQPMLRPAEALQKAMLDMLHSKDPDFQNPAFWAPFTVVGG